MDKMKFGADMSALEEYVNQLGNAEIIRAIAGSAPSIQYFAHQLGVNEKTDLHLMSTSVSFKDGRNCSFSDDNSFAFSDRQLDPAFLKTEDAICANEMLGKWLGYNERISASNAELPFEEAFVSEYIKAAGEELEKIIWNGVTVGGKDYNGFANWIEAEGQKVAVAEGSDAYDMVRALILSFPAKSAKKTEIFVSEPFMMALKDALLKRDFRLIDLQFSNGAEVDEHTIKMPVFGTLIHEVSGLNGNEKIYALVPEHAVYGTSVEGAHTDVKMVYDEVNDRFIMRIKLTEATQIAYPSETLYAVMGSSVITPGDEYNFTSYSPEGAVWATGKAEIMGLVKGNSLAKIKVLENSVPEYVGQIFYIDADAEVGAEKYPLYTNTSKAEAGIEITIDSKVA